MATNSRADTAWMDLLPVQRLVLLEDDLSLPCTGKPNPLGCDDYYGCKRHAIGAGVPVDEGI